MSSSFEMRLVGAAYPDGEIPLRLLGELAASLNDLSLRIGRSWDSAERPGRTRALVDDISQLTLTGLERGSTHLSIRRGVETLDVTTPELRQVDALFWDVIVAIGADRRPEGISDYVADATARVVSSMKAAAPRIHVRASGRADIDVTTTALHEGTWAVRTSAPGERVSVAGTLEKVDLRSHDFRIRDDVGNAIALHQVRQDADVAALISRRVVVTGAVAATRDRGVSELRDVAVALDHAFQDGWKVPDPVSLEAILDAAPGPRQAGDLGLDDDELHAFLEAAEG